VELSETVTLPEGYEAVHLPTCDPVEGSGADFEGGYEKAAGQVTFKVRLELKKRIYEPSDYKSFAKAVKGMKHLMEEEIVLKR
jgi:hypothetical protein